MSEFENITLEECMSYIPYNSDTYFKVYNKLDKVIEYFKCRKGIIGYRVRQLGHLKRIEDILIGIAEKNNSLSMRGVEYLNFLTKNDYRAILEFSPKVWLKPNANGRLRVYPHLQGQSYLQSGYIFAPYIPLYTSTSSGTISSTTPLTKFHTIATPKFGTGSLSPFIVNSVSLS